MTTITMPTPAAERTTLGTVLRAERIKLASIRSTRTAATLAVLGSAAFTALMAVGLVLAPTEERVDVDEMIATTFGDRPTLGAIAYALLVAPALVAVLGALIVTTERSTGVIAVTVAAVPRRGLIVSAKLLTSGVLSFLIGVLVGVSAFWIAEPSFAANGRPQAFLDVATAQVIVGGAAYLALVGALAAALAFLVRSTAGAIGLVLGLLLVLPGVVQLIPVAGPAIAAILPSSLGSVLSTPVGDAGWMPLLAALGGLLAWVAAAAGAALVTFTRTDA